MEIKKYETMAKLELSEAEREQLSSRMDTLVRDFSLLDEIDTEGTEPLISVLDILSSLREDIVKKWESPQELLSAAPDEDRGFFRIPRALG